jgi:hypothetical protein
MYVGTIQPAATGFTERLPVVVADTKIRAEELTYRWIRERGHPQIHYSVFIYEIEDSWVDVTRVNVSLIISNEG